MARNLNNVDCVEADVFTLFETLMRHGQLEMFRHRLTDSKSSKISNSAA